MLLTTSCHHQAGSAFTDTVSVRGTWVFQGPVLCHPDTGSQVSLSPRLSAQYVKARSPRAALPPLYALELLTIYAWEVGTQESESFGLDEGLATVMELLQEHASLCIFWTTFYTLQSPVVEAVVRQQLQRARYGPPPTPVPGRRAEGGCSGCLSFGKGALLSSKAARKS